MNGIEDVTEQPHYGIQLFIIGSNLNWCLDNNLPPLNFCSQFLFSSFFSREFSLKHPNILGDHLYQVNLLP